MKLRLSSKAAPSTSSDEFRHDDVDWELRPGGMIVQKRHVVSASDPRLITIKVSHGAGSYHHLLTLDAHSTFGDLKRVLRQETGLEPREQRLLFRGKEKENDEWLHMAGVNHMSKVILMEDPASQDRKRTTTTPGEALADITAEIDKLSVKVVAVEGGVNGGKKVEEKEVNVLTEMLMMQLLKLDAIETDDGDAKLQRRTQVVRVQNFVDRLDNLKAKSSNPLNQTTNNNNNTTVSSATAKWETFESGFGSFIPPTSKLTISSTKITHDWELFD